MPPFFFFFLPISRSESEEFGLKEWDVIIVIGDAYIDHLVFGDAKLRKRETKFQQKEGHSFLFP